MIEDDDSSFLILDSSDRSRELDTVPGTGYIDDDVCLLSLL